MKSKFVHSLFALAVVILVVPSCIIVTDGHGVLHHAQGTIVRDLHDLDVARDKGLISQEEYDRARDRILDGD